MFKVIGIRETLRNIIRITKSHLKGDPNRQSLQIAYRDFLREAQPRVPIPENVNLSYKWKKEDVSPLLEIFKEDSVLDDFEEVFDLNAGPCSRRTLENIQHAIKKMGTTQPHFAALIDLVIHTIFTFPSKLAGGGSTSAAIGCIWADIRPSWVEQDILEFLVHETTHNLVFIDELCFTHYTSYPDIARSDNFAQSAILNKPRPLDKVFHSILVSTEILLFRQDNFGHPEKPCLHPPSHVLLSQTSQSIDSIKEVESFLTDRAKYLLVQCIESLKSIELDQVICV